MKILDIVQYVLLGGVEVFEHLVVIPVFLTQRLEQRIGRSLGHLPVQGPEFFPGFFHKGGDLRQYPLQFLLQAGNDVLDAVSFLFIQFLEFVRRHDLAFFGQRGEGETGRRLD